MHIGACHQTQACPHCEKILYVAIATFQNSAEWFVSTQGCSHGINMPYLDRD